jgi:calcium/calmodulin-dependent protein kinase I
MTETTQNLGSTLEDENGATLFKFEDDYVLDKRLRSGSYGVVFTTLHKGTNDEYAVKVIDRTKLKKKDDDATFREVNIMKDLVNVPNIVGLIDFYVEPQTFYVVQVYAKGGDVFDRIAQRVSYNEKDARDLGLLLLKTMKELHLRKICHRDLKPENLLLKEKGDDAEILVADFGFAKYVPDEGLKTRCGTPAFVAPEILVGDPYNTQADMWSVGCLLYMLIGGYPPFQDETHRGLFRKIRAADFTFHDMYWANVSVHAKELISKLLTVDPELRLNADTSLHTTWLEVRDDQLSVRDLSGSVSEIKKFSAKRKLKSAMHAVMWGVSTAFRTEKVSELLQITDKKDEESKSMNIEEVAEDQHATRFNIGATHKKRFEELYDLGEKIHRGSFAVVKECRHRAWDEKYAVKIIRRDGRTDEAVLHEVAIMNQLDHEHIVKVIDFFEEEECYYIVMELMGGGDVFDRIIAMNHYTEADARDLAKILLDTVNYMHQSGIAHRDLKPQNLLLRVSSSFHFVCHKLPKSDRSLRSFGSTDQRGQCNYQNC